MAHNANANPSRLGILMGASIIGALLVGCSSASSASSTPTFIPSPKPDLLTQNYIAVVRNYWSDHLIAEGNAVKVCWANALQDVTVVNLPQCRVRSLAILAATQKFLSDLGNTPAPAKFSADDQVFRRQLPKAIADVKAMIAAADKGSKDAMLQAATAYVTDMIPSVTDALDDVDPSVVHE